MTIRPPVGFIVEGHGEYNCYPSLFSRINNANNLYIPRINAGGYGGIVKRLKEQLTDMLQVASPLTVIVTLDLEDVLKDNVVENCAELLQNLNDTISEWRAAADLDPRLHPLPERIVCVLQIKKFETWIISDVQGLKDAGLVNNDIEEIDNAENVESPCNWIKENVNISGTVKSPNVAKVVISALNPDVMRTHSRSFDKFYRESQIAYSIWHAQFAGN